MTGIGIVGAGHFGAVHARAIAEIDGLELVAACREDADAAAGFTRQFGGVPYSDWRALLDDPRVDAVVIATPHHLHEEIAIGAARAGKHVLLEKPMAPTVAACAAINAAVATAGVKLMVGHVMHFALPCLKAKEVLDAGTIGRPLLGSSWMIKLWMESNRRPWHLQRASGGGMLMTAGIHALDRLVWLMGQPVTSVGALVGTLFHEQQADDSALIGLRFAGGGIGQVQSVGYRDGAVGFAMDLVCERGTLRIDFDSGTWVGRNGTWTLLEHSIEPDWMHHAVVREWRAVQAAIDDSAEIAVDGAYASHIVEIIEAAHRANALRREVELGK
ncbi:MAG: 1-carboxy-3-chloro-3,4-dihydroxycyclo hexa-1,5-diene dehydrogenase [Devosia sp. 67-54]|uniref:Gfo/Idh/MocA family protein n=1 Tax=unclassified Devosia TaxID=196773 RepID=UPI00095C0435|nr:MULTISPECIES: Gfo/Idh/MocA family oxidoreductase [unclassified Devosia]MBN9306665.1 Gfo/Idh/MocA family oxidoreductase [Devosia sp.]OJX15939.1 MAG: 1-carboxy-3-chloro-3,4-dihydroxycyclo hexa-1,5-diene dehydrogenase [Devosia sp. 67-54]